MAEDSGSQQDGLIAMVRNTGYRIQTYTLHIGIEDDLKSARWRAFSIVMKNKTLDIFIINHYTGELVGMVDYSKKKDKYGREYGPMWWSERKNKSYLLDYDGTIFDVKTGRRVPGQYERKSKK